MNKYVEYVEKSLVELVGQEYIDQLIAATAPAHPLVALSQNVVTQDGVIGEWCDAPVTSQPGPDAEWCDTPATSQYHLPNADWSDL